jgi:uncharacterized protein
MTHPILQDTKGGAILTIHVQPKASRTECAGIYGGAVKIRVAAPPVDGKANEALVAFLAERLDMAPSGIEILAGASGRHKRVLLKRCAARDVLVRLGLSANGSRES